MKKVIVTGATGFIGTHLVQELLSHDIEVYVFVMPNENIAGKFPDDTRLHVVECFLEQMKDFDTTDLRSANIDTFYHLAWAGTAGNGRSDEKMQLANAQYCADAVLLAHQICCRRFVCAGSIMEIEAFEATNAQGNKLNTAYIYGMAKLVSHTITKSLCASLNIEHIWPMITNAYGVGEKSPRFINTTLRKIINGEKLEFTSGTQNYDFVYVDDVVRAFYLIGERGQAFHQYIIGSGKAGALRGFIEKIGNTLAPEKELIFGDIPYTGTNLSLSAFSIDELVHDTDFAIAVPFAEGIKRTYKWLQKEESKNDSKV